MNFFNFFFKKKTTGNCIFYDPSKKKLARNLFYTLCAHDNNMLGYQQNFFFSPPQKFRYLIIKWAMRKWAILCAVIPKRFGTGENRTQYEGEWHDCGTGRSKRPKRRDRSNTSLYRVNLKGQWRGSPEVPKKKYPPTILDLQMPGGLLLGG